MDYSVFINVLNTPSLEGRPCHVDARPIYGNTKANTKTCVEFKYITKNITYETYMYFDDDTNMTKNIRHHTQSDIKLNSNFSKQPS